MTKSQTDSVITQQEVVMYKESYEIMCPNCDDCMITIEQVTYGKYSKKTECPSCGYVEPN